ncbi:hypothetical protein KI688_002239 [Linnemannia hyalina]|uniref:Uncharacterized protein n=1 Tax=Linnemannia hyalina TaxID=64524 RepID=A0A9P7XRU5_9FUNG|nr:hypothetical protein KI688_002239 [Linnemannia hyalina]
MGSQAVSSQQGNLDLERGPNSGSIPNNGQRPYPLLRPSSTPPPAPMRATEKEQEEKQQSEVATIRLTAPDAMVALPTATQKENTTKKTNGPIVSSSSSSSAEESDVSVTRAKLTNLTLVRKDEQEQRQQRKQGNRIPKDTNLVGKGKGEVSHDNKNNRETMIHSKVPELVVHSASITSSPNLARGGAATVGGHQSSQQQHSHPAPGVATAITPPSQRPSERLTRLLNPSLSTTSLPSLSKTTSQPVVAVISPNHHHTDSIANSTDSASSHRKDSSPSQQDTPPPTESAVDLVSKLLNPVVTLGRSRSQSSLHSMFTNALSGSPSSSSATTGQHQRRHARHGSAASLAESVKSNTGSSSTGMGMGMGFMTSPPRVSDPNLYLISRFITPASQQHAVLSSSAPKQQAGSLSGSSSAGSLAARRRLPPSLRMTSSDMDVPAAAGGVGTSTAAVAAAAVAAAAAASGTTPSSPGAVSTYSSAEGPTPTHSHSTTPLPPHSSPSSNASSSPWNPVESMSRTQQKLNLQRDSSHDDLDEEEMARRGRAHREMERIQREYKCIRMTSDPVLESMSRCFALQRQQQSEVLGGEEGMGLNLGRFR